MNEISDKRKSQLRCLNCFTRFEPAEKATEVKCPKCEMEWRITWPANDSVKIRGPVWSTVK